MAGRAAAALLVTGDSPTVALVDQLAEQLGIPRVAPGWRGRLPVVALVGATSADATSAGVRSVLAAPTAPAAVFVEPPSVAAEPGGGTRSTGERTAASWFDEASAAPAVGAALYLAWSPLVAAAGRAVAGAGVLRHVDVRIRQPNGAGFPVALAVAAWTLAGHDITTVAGTAPGRARLQAAGTLVEVDGTAATLPEWSMQAATDDTVVRLEMAPTVSLERNGDALPIVGDGPDEDRALVAARHLGVLGFLDDLRAGSLLDPRRRPPGAHPGWGQVVERLLAAHATSLSGGGAPTAPG